MGNLLLFLSNLIHYLWVYGLSIILIIVACIAGVKWRKSKDAKEALAGEKTLETTEKTE